MSAVIYTLDLSCSSKSTASGARTGVSVQIAMSEAALLKKAEGAGLVVLDLNIGGLQPGELVPKLQSLDSPPRAIVAFGPHVHTEKLQVAQEAGCAHVLTQGQFYGGLDELLEQLAGEK